MRDALTKRLFRVLNKSVNKYRRFVERRYFWVSLAQTRVLLSLGSVGVFTIVSISLGLSEPLQRYWLIVGIYCCLCVILIFFREERLRSGRVRLIADFADVVFISSFISISHNISSSLFWLYLFPVLSAARYKRTKGTAQVALIVVLTYLFLFYRLVPSLAVVPLILWIFLILLGVAKTKTGKSKLRLRRLVQFLSFV